MKDTHRSSTLATFTLVLANVSAALLAFNMVAIPVFHEEVFLLRDALTSVELLMMCGFGSVLIFNISAAVWITHSMLNPPKSANRGARRASVEHFGPGMLALAVLCTVLMAGEKMMIDEIGRETLLGWEPIGEWIILYGLFAVQLTFCILTAVRLKDPRALEPTCPD